MLVINLGLTNGTTSMNIQQCFHSEFVNTLGLKLSKADYGLKFSFGLIRPALEKKKVPNYKPLKNINRSKRTIQTQNQFNYLFVLRFS